MTDPSKPAVSGPEVTKLAAKVAHELNNPLDAVLRFVSLAQRKARSGQYEDIDRHLADAQFGLQRMVEILRELMDIGRQTNEVLTRQALGQVPLAELVARATRTTAAQAEQKRICVQITNTLPQDKAPSYDLRVAQILANLLKNALDASPEGAAVTLQITAAGSALQIIVTDAGPGLNPDLLPHLFTPFVTTKPQGTGHGLGLAISRELALSLKGTLSLDNRVAPATGCIATLVLPIS